MGTPPESASFYMLNQDITATLNERSFLLFEALIFAGVIASFVLFEVYL